MRPVATHAPLLVPTWPSCIVASATGSVQPAEPSRYRRRAVSRACSIDSAQRFGPGAIRIGPTEP